MTTEKKADQARVDANAKVISSISATSEANRIDANEVVFLAKELEYMRSRVFETIYGENKEFQFLTVDSSVPVGAETIKYFMWDRIGMAEVIANGATDYPSVTALKKEFFSKVVTIGDAYSYSIFDLRAASMANGGSLSEQMPRIARRAIEDKAASMLAFGDSTVGITGLFNNSNVSIATLPNTGVWSGLTADEMFENLLFVYDTIDDATKETMPPNYLVMAPRPYNSAMNTYFGTDRFVSVLRRFSEEKGVEVVRYAGLANAGAGSTDRIAMWHKNPDTAVFNMPLAFESLPPQAQGANFYVYNHARVGGVEMRYPVAFAYADIATS